MPTAAAIGEGGTGAVFHARDTKLDRDVALTVLPEAVAHDAERLARFTRDAKTLASLNYPHIAARRDPAVTTDSSSASMDRS